MNDPDNPGTSKVSDHDNLTMLNFHLGTLRRDISDIKGVMQKLADTVSKVGVVEQDHEHTKRALDRAFDEIKETKQRIAAMEALGPAIHNVPTIIDRVRTLEAGMVNASRTSGWVDKAMWIAAGTGLSGTVIGSVVFAILTSTGAVK